MAAPFRIESPVARAMAAAQKIAGGAALAAPGDALAAGTPSAGAAAVAAPAAAPAAVTPAPGGPVPPPGPPPSGGLSSYLEILIKLIPAEVIALYLVGIGVIPPAQRLALAIWAGICFGCVIVVRAFGTADKARRLGPQWKAVAVSAVSYVIWVYNMPGPFQTYGIAVPYIGSLAVLVWTFVVPFFYKP